LATGTATDNPAAWGGSSEVTVSATPCHMSSYGLVRYPSEQNGTKGFPVLPDLEAAAVLLAEIHREFRACTLFQWGVELTGGQLVGICTLARLDAANRRAELGFALGRAFWGRGYMADALPAVMEFVFGPLGLHRVVADTDPRNA